MNPIAALDLGTNSTRFFCVNRDVTSIEPSNLLARGMEITRLGEGVDENGVIGKHAMDRVIDVVHRFNRKIQDLDGEWVGCLATSACRRANEESTKKLFQKIHETIGVEPQIIDGSKEAKLTYFGIRCSLDVQTGTIIDIGGGSTEWISFDGGDLKFTESLPLGVVTLNERCVKNDSYTEEAYACMDREIRQLFQPEFIGSGQLISVGGTGTTLASMMLDLDQYRPDQVHGYHLDKESIRNTLDEMLNKSFEVIARNPMVQSGREDVIVPGIKILESARSKLEAERVTVSDMGILAGFLSEYLQQ